MICITVSTNYDYLLDIIIPQNYKFFKKWYIITDINDRKTINVINKYKKDCIEILYFDFYKNARFNKGGAIKYAQKMLNENETVLLLDSDIFIPDDFSRFTNLSIQPDTLYSIKRYDYYTYNNFINNIVDRIYDIDFMGFFQLYKHSENYCYEDSDSCRECDSNFSMKFKEKILLDNIIVKHLGEDNKNHFGKKTTSTNSSREYGDNGEIVLSCDNVCSVKYGTRDYSIDVTAVAFEKCLHNNELIIPSGDFARSDLFTDPVYGVTKCIFIEYDSNNFDNNFVEYGDNGDIILQANEVSCIKYGTRDYSIDITNAAFQKCVDNNILTIPSGDFARVDLFTDPVYGITKSIFIRGTL